MMALVNVKRGIPYAIFGLLALLVSLLLFTSFTRTSDTMGWLQIDRRWLVVHGVATLLAVITFELLRLASALEERSGRPKIPRLIASMLVPSAVILLGGPKLVSAWPQLVESAWFAALVLAFGALPGAIWCTFEGTMLGANQRRKFRIVGASVLTLLVVGLVVTIVMSDHLLSSVSAAAAAAGFQVLPNLLG